MKILPGPAAMLKVAYIITASKPEADRQYVINDRNALIESDFVVENVDIEGMNKFDLRDKLMTFDIIYVQGGNTYYLMAAMHRCQFSEVIREVLDNGAIYVGVSAGSIVAGPDIAVASWKEADENKVGLEDLTGLYLVDFAVYPHFTDKITESVARGIMKAPYKVKFIHDNEALVIRGKDIDLVAAK